MNPAGRWARWEAPGLAVTLLVALLLRLNNYSQAPLPADNQDELDWTWSGLGIITRGVPYGWSNLQAYTAHIRVAANGTTFAVTHPFLDHPPLFSLLVGGVAWLQGARDLADVTVPMIRPVPIALGMVSILLVYLLGRRVLGAPAALLGAAVLASAPAAVLMQRQVEAESLLAPMMLLALIALERRLVGDTRRRWIVLLLACCALAPLAKVSGAAVAGGAAAILLGARQVKLALLAAGAGLLGVAAFFAYGLFYDADLFMRVIKEAETHRYGVLGVWAFIASPAGPSGAVHHLRDGWWLLGWLGVGAATGFVPRPRRDLLLWPLAAYAVVIMVAAEAVQDYGWFRVAILPVIYLAAGCLAWQAITRPSAPALLAVLALGGATATSTLFGEGKTGWTPPAFLLLGGLALAVVPALLAHHEDTSPRLRLAARGLAVIAVAAVLACNVATSAQLDVLYTQL